MKKFEGPLVPLSDCYKAISSRLKTPNFEVLTYEQLPFSEINGYLGEHCTLKATIKRTPVPETLSFFIKSPPRVPSQLNFLHEINGIFKETNFFKKYLPLLKTHGITLLDDALPVCYHVTDGTFFFQDLSPLGFRTLPSRAPLSLNHVKAALATFAKLHASALILEEVKSFRLPETFGVELKERV